VRFQQELANLLPDDLPNRLEVIRKGSVHLARIEETNRYFNLTRITGAREAAIKHVLDSILPWRLFQEARHILDAGSGAGFPGIPLALVFPEIPFTLSESTGKKARFIEETVKELDMANVGVVSNRAEEVLRTVRPDILTARAVAPLDRAVALFTPALRRGTRALLYKGPDAEAEIAKARSVLSKSGLDARVVAQYALPDDSGSRTVVQLTAKM
jgi:16S rRNA (guanine527-N7)-methyltransferase